MTPPLAIAPPPATLSDGNHLVKPRPCMLSLSSSMRKSCCPPDACVYACVDASATHRRCQLLYFFANRCVIGFSASSWHSRHPVKPPLPVYHLLRGRYLRSKVDAPSSSSYCYLVRPPLPPPSRSLATTAQDCPQSCVCRRQPTRVLARPPLDACPQHHS